MNTLETRLAAKLRAAISDEIASTKSAMAAGRPQDWSAYRDLVGKVRGFETVLQIMSDIEKSLND